MVSRQERTGGSTSAEQVHAAGVGGCRGEEESVVFSRAWESKGGGGGGKVLSSAFSWKEASGECKRCGRG